MDRNKWYEVIRHALCKDGDETAMLLEKLRTPPTAPDVNDFGMCWWTQQELEEKLPPRSCRCTTCLNGLKLEGTRSGSLLMTIHRARRKFEDLLLLHELRRLRGSGGAGGVGSAGRLGGGAALKAEFKMLATSCNAM